MCGIFALFSPTLIKQDKQDNKDKQDKQDNKDTNILKKYALKMSDKLKHRGPDASGLVETQHSIIAHNRLAIIDLSSDGVQPFKNNDNNLILCVNGEIFNYKDIKNVLKDKYNYDYKYKSNSDCETILALYEYYASVAVPIPVLSHNNIVKMLGMLDGQFSFVLHCTKTNMVLVARDPYAITQLYWGIDMNGNIQIASEIKALETCIRVEILPGGSYLYFNVAGGINSGLPVITPIFYFLETEKGSWLSKYDPNFYEQQPILSNDDQNILMCNIRTILETEVEKRLMCDMPNGFAVCLSGGLDSSLLASITMRYMKAHPEKYGLKPVLHTFSIGIKDESNDLIYAREVANFIGSTHHELHFTPEDAIKELHDTIYYTETYDITTVRCSILHRIMSKKIKEMGFKMVLSGEGADEILGGYLYFHQAPGDIEHQSECKKRLLELGYFDCLRVDKSSMSASVETRVPYLAYDFVKLLINVNKDVKTQKGIEKYIVRKAFDVKDSSGIPVYLPESVLWRLKIQFSTGIGHRHIDTLKAYTEEQVNEKYLSIFENRCTIYPFNTPPTKEALYYRIKFNEYFPNRENVVRYWFPNTTWPGITNIDPSGLSSPAYQKNEAHTTH